jgi:hypothetical protein
MAAVHLRDLTLMAIHDRAQCEFKKVRSLNSVSARARAQRNALRVCILRLSPFPFIHDVAADVQPQTSCAIFRSHTR